MLRIDTDSVAAKYSLEKKLDQFARGEYDVMVGTQMVAKGLDFENVTLVGVLSADQSLFSDDFRSNERTFDLLTQVVGRAGRGKISRPGHHSNLRAGKSRAASGGPAGLFWLITARRFFSARPMLYPPFVDILVIGFVGRQGASGQTGSGNVFSGCWGSLPRRNTPICPCGCFGRPRRLWRR